MENLERVYLCKYTNLEINLEIALTSTRTSTIINHRKYLDKYKLITEVGLHWLVSGIWSWDCVSRCGSRDGIPVWTSRAVSPGDGVSAAERNCLFPMMDCVSVAEERSFVMNNKCLSPCVGCIRVADPENCTDKSCRVWQAWFLQQWEQTRDAVRQLKDVPQPKAGVPLGGRRYAAPHQTRSYLRTDPCGECLCPSGLCRTPCRKRLVWEDCIREDE